MGDQWNVCDTSFHEGLGEDSGWAVGGFGCILGGFAGFPSCVDAFVLYIVIFVYGAWEFDVELLWGFIVLMIDRMTY